MTAEPDGSLESARQRRGLSAFARLLSVTEAEVGPLLAGRVGAVFAQETIRAAGGDAWRTAVLSARERHIAVITALAAQGVAGDRMSTHVRLARADGLDQETLTAVLTMLSVYVGHPRASLAMEVVVDVFSSPP